MALSGVVNSRNTELYLTNAPCKISKTMLVKQHMNAHKNKITRVKSSIDTSCPKTWTSSTKIRDQLKKQQRIQKTPSSSRPGSARRTPKPESQISAFAYEYGYSNAEGNFHHQDSPDRLSAYRNDHTTDHPSSARQQQASILPDYYKFGAGNSQVLVEPDPSADVLDRRPEKFSEAAPFTPRTLKKNSAQSKLRQSRCYNPPPNPPPSAGKRQRETGDNMENKSARSERVSEGIIKVQHSAAVHAAAPVVRATPQMPSVRPQGNRGPNPPGPGSKQRQVYSIGGSGTRVSNDKGEEGAGGYGLGIGHQTPHPPPPKALHQPTPLAGVPAFDIHSDLDKMRWIQQQAEQSKVRHEVLKGSQEYGDGRSTFDYRSIDLGQMSGPVSKLMLSSTMQKVQEEEEELRYLEFISNVTQDILSRGVFTNRALNQVVDYHLKNNHMKIKQSRLPMLVDKLRADLGIERTADDFKDPLADYDRFRYLDQSQDRISTSQCELANSQPDPLDLSASYSSNVSPTRQQQLERSLRFEQFASSSIASLDYHIPTGNNKNNDTSSSSRCEIEAELDSTTSQTRLEKLGLSPSVSLNQDHRSVDRQESIDFVDSGHRRNSGGSGVAEVGNTGDDEEENYDYGTMLREAMVKSDKDKHLEEEEEKISTDGGGENVSSYPPSSPHIQLTNTNANNYSLKSSRPLGMTMKTSELETLMTVGAGGSGLTPIYSSGSTIDSMAAGTNELDSGQMGKSVHFANQDDVFSSTRGSDDMTLTDVTLLQGAGGNAGTEDVTKPGKPSSGGLQRQDTMDMTIMREHLPHDDEKEENKSKKTEAEFYEDDFDDDDDAF